MAATVLLMWKWSEHSGRCRLNLTNLFYCSWSRKMFFLKFLALFLGLTFWFLPEAWENCVFQNSFRTKIQIQIFEMRFKFKLNNMSSVRIEGFYITVFFACIMCFFFCHCCRLLTWYCVLPVPGAQRVRGQPGDALLSHHAPQPWQTVPHLGCSCDDRRPGQHELKGHSGACWERWVLQASLRWRDGCRDLWKGYEGRQG